MEERGQEDTHAPVVVSVERPPEVTPSGSPAPETSERKRKIVSILSHSVVDAKEKNGGEDGGSNAEQEKESSSSPSRGLSHRLCVEWDDGSQSVEPISRAVEEDLLLVLRYLNRHKLMVRYGASSAPSSSTGGGGESRAAIENGCGCWVDQLPEHIRKQVPVVLRPDPKDVGYESNLRHLSLVDRALFKGLNSLDDTPHYTDDSYRTLREGVYELFVAGTFLWLLARLCSCRRPHSRLVSLGLTRYYD
jgi:hypothetical protein